MEIVLVTPTEKDGLPILPEYHKRVLFDELNVEQLFLGAVVGPDKSAVYTGIIDYENEAYENFRFNFARYLFLTYLSNKRILKPGSEELRTAIQNRGLGVRPNVEQEDSLRSIIVREIREVDRLGIETVREELFKLVVVNFVDLYVEEIDLPGEEFEKFMAGYQRQTYRQECYHTADGTGKISLIRLPSLGERDNFEIDLAEKIPGISRRFAMRLTEEILRFPFKREQILEDLVPELARPELLRDINKTQDSFVIIQASATAERKAIMSKVLDESKPAGYLDRIRRYIGLRHKSEGLRRTYSFSPRGSLFSEITGDPFDIMASAVSELEETDVSADDIIRILGIKDNIFNVDAVRQFQKIYGIHVLDPDEPGGPGGPGESGRGYVMFLTKELHFLADRVYLPTVKTLFLNQDPRLSPETRPDFRKTVGDAIKDSGGNLKAVISSHPTWGLVHASILSRRGWCSGPEFKERVFRVPFRAGPDKVFSPKEFEENCLEVYPKILRYVEDHPEMIFIVYLEAPEKYREFEDVTRNLILIRKWSEKNLERFLNVVRVW